MKNILWIDDDELLMQACIPSFEEVGINILMATNGTRALKILNEFELDIDGVLLDVQLNEGENGLELLEILLEKRPNLNIVIFTAYPDNSDNVQSILAGASVYLSKLHKSIPIDEAEHKKFFLAIRDAFDKSHEKSEQIVELAVEEKIPFYKQWWFLSIIGGIFTSVVAYLLIPSTFITWRLAVMLGILAAFIFMFRNPQRRYLRAFYYVFSALAIWNILPSLQLFFKNNIDDNDTIFSLFLETLDWQINIGLIVLMIVLLILDYFSAKK